ncbi:uncharacterized protein TNIN_462231 [Trichonephila inaurata madagascariensis]|uniref:Uncharacterized protein n=1 Tax=Trichonephila inaurata madagascariensis TaxID=2747483 RepID=A0A8X6YSC3_9ARAC|nr:uncharacterized protein TNIN_462231 [Trichonephila inaurata madagascariensis]
MSDNRTVASILLAEPSANRNSNHVVSYPFNDSCINIVMKYKIFCVSHSKKLNSSTRISSSSSEHFILKPELKEFSARNVYKISSVECLNAILSDDLRVSTTTEGSCSKLNEKVKFGYFSSTFGIRRIQEIEV